MVARHRQNYVLLTLLRSDFLSRFACDEDVGEVCVSDFSRLDFFSEKVSSADSGFRFFEDSEK